MPTYQLPPKAICKWLLEVGNQSTVRNRPCIGPTENGGWIAIGVSACAHWRAGGSEAVDRTTTSPLSLTADTFSKLVKSGIKAITVLDDMAIEGTQLRASADCLRYDATTPTGCVRFPVGAIDLEELAAVREFAAYEKSSPALTGVCLASCDGRLVMMASDGKWLAASEVSDVPKEVLEQESFLNGDVILPSAAALPLPPVPTAKLITYRLARNKPEDDYGVVTACRAMLTGGECQIVFRLIAGRFPAHALRFAGTRHLFANKNSTLLAVGGNRRVMLMPITMTNEVDCRDTLMATAKTESVPLLGAVEPCTVGEYQSQTKAKLREQIAMAEAKLATLKRQWENMQG